GRDSRMWQSGGMPRTLYRDAALADGTGPDLRVGVSPLVDGDRIEWIRPADDEPDPGPDVTVIDASGCTIVPGMVDSHSHLTLPGGAHWIQRGFDPPERLLQVAEHNARLLRSAGERQGPCGRGIGGGPRRTPGTREARRRARAG